MDCADLVFFCSVVSDLVLVVLAAIEGSLVLFEQAAAKLWKVAAAAGGKHNIYRSHLCLTY